jgi:retinol-binding protein 3
MRFLINCLFWLAFGLAVANPTCAVEPSIPDTAVGNVLQSWVNTFNEGDPVRIEHFLRSYGWPRDIEQQQLFRRLSGGIDLIGIEKSERDRIVFRLRDKSDPAEAFGKIVIQSGAMPAIVAFSIYEAAPGASYPEFVLDARVRKHVLDWSRKFIQEFYVDPVLATKMGIALEQASERHSYDSFVDAEIFSQKLTDDLRAISHDKHLSIDYTLVAEPEFSLADKKKRDDASRKDIKRQNCGFERAENLQSNIGYLKLNFFAAPDICGDTAVAAMNFLEDSDAIIFDLRENGGGAPRMIALLQTYLFDKPTHLNDLYLRKEDQTDQYWTLPYVPGKRMADKPVFVLTSAVTFSAAEEFAYDLKKLDRATVIGETTGGGAHPVSVHRIDDHFSISVPYARAINPVSKDSWEGKGVEPDVQISSDEALNKAIEMAKQQIQKASINAQP